MGSDFNDVFSGADLPRYTFSTAKGSLNFVFHGDSILARFYETDNLQFYKNTDNGAVMLKSFSFPLYNGNNEFFSCDCMFFYGYNSSARFDYFVSGLYPEIDYTTASSSLKSDLDNLKNGLIYGNRLLNVSLPFNLKTNGNPFVSLALGSIVSVSGFSNLFLVNKTYSLHLSSFKIIVFYDLWSIDFASSKLNEIFLQRLFCPASLLDRANLDDAKQYKEAVLLRYILGGYFSSSKFYGIVNYKEEDGVDFKVGIANLLDDPNEDHL